MLETTRRRAALSVARARLACTPITIGTAMTAAAFTLGVAPAGASPSLAASLVRDIAPGPAGSIFGPFQGVSVGTKIVFYADGNGGLDQELWVSDGTADGTAFLADIRPGGLTSRVRSFSDNLVEPQMTRSGLHAYFLADDGTTGPELWVSDGTTDGTHLVADIAPGPTGSYPVDFTDVDGRLFFTADDGTTGRELWVTDGTQAGTHLVSDIFPGSTSLGGNPSNPSFLTAFKGDLYFAATSPTVGIELMRSDGTDEGTVVLADIRPGPNQSSNPAHLAATADTLYLAATDDNGRLLWRSDGTTAGTQRVVDTPEPFPALWPGESPTELVVVGDRVFFVASDGPFNHAFELWVSDGTAAGTEMVNDASPGSASSTMRDGVAVGDLLLYKCTDQTVVPRLCRSDGTDAGTYPLAPLGGAGFPSFTSEITSFGSFALFRGDSRETGMEPWISSGIPAGTRLVQDIRPGDAWSFAGKFIGLGDAILFFANDEVHGTELWRFDPAPDTTAPQLTLPASVPADATSPSGGLASWTATAADDVDGAISVSCVPESGTVLPIGDTTVTCSAVDSSGNRAEGSFTVHVAGALKQLDQLAATVQARATTKLGTSLLDKLNTARKGLVAGRKRQACEALHDFVALAYAQSAKGLSVEEATLYVTSARRIMVVVGCS